jgi:glycosyltransferase involved in cell wall biosynthesis
MKNIAIVITRMIEGGAANIVRQIIKGGRGRFEFTLYTGTEDLPEGGLKDIENDADIIKISSMRRQVSPHNDFRSFLFLCREFRRKKFDVVHTHTSKAGVIGRLAARCGGIENIIHSTHGTIYSQDGKIHGVPNLNFYKRILLGADRFAGRKADFLTVLSRNEYDISAELSLSPPEKILVIPNGIDLNVFSYEAIATSRNASRRELGIKDEECLILNIGRLASEKGHSVLIEAFRRLGDGAGMSQKIRLGIVGDGPLKESLEKANDDLIRSGKLVFYGYDKDVRKYLSSSDIFTLPSFYEGFGIAVLEAMASGVPVIASNVGGIPEIIEDGVQGFLFERGDSEKLAGELQKLIKSPELRKKMGDNGVLRSKMFGTDAMLKKYYELYDK